LKKLFRSYGAHFKQSFITTNVLLLQSKLIKIKTVSQKTKRFKFMKISEDYLPSSILFFNSAKASISPSVDFSSFEELAAGLASFAAFSLHL
jgi:hypothetical protein